MDNNCAQKVYIDLIYHPLKSLGPGERVGIWFQGCTLACKECVSQHTWEQTEDKLYFLEDVTERLVSLNCKKLTISGGEPFQQPDALYALLATIKDEFDDILVYSGYTYQYLEKNFANILSLIDILVDGIFMNTLPTNKMYKGSDNQKMYILNDRHLSSYALFAKDTNRVMQLHQGKDKTYLLGIPDMNNVESIQKILNGE